MSFTYHLPHQPGVFVAIGEGEHSGTVVPLNSADYFTLKRNRRPRTLSRWMEVEAERAHRLRLAKICEMFMNAVDYEGDTPDGIDEYA